MGPFTGAHTRTCGIAVLASLLTPLMQHLYKCTELSNLSTPPPVRLNVSLIDLKAIFCECLEDVVGLRAALIDAFQLELMVDVIRKVETNAGEWRFQFRLREAG
jgi:hypothetical protein